MLGYAYKLNYPANTLTITAQDPPSCWRPAKAASSVNTSDPLPDDELNNEWNASVLDHVSGRPKAGPECIDRLTIQVESSAATGLYHLILTNNTHTDQDGLPASPDLTFNASIAVDAPCDSDGDGWNDATEDAIGTHAQQNCGTTGWPADLRATVEEINTGISALNITDLASFVAQLRPPQHQLRRSWLQRALGPHPRLDRRRADKHRGHERSVSGTTGLPAHVQWREGIRFELCPRCPTPTPSPPLADTSTHLTHANPNATPSRHRLQRLTPPRRLADTITITSASPSPSPSASPSPSPSHSRRHPHHRHRLRRHPLNPTPPPTSSSSATPSPTPGVVTLNATDDAYVAAASPTTTSARPRICNPTPTPYESPI